MNPQRIVRLKAENVKRLKAVEITPEGEIVVIGGKNGAGKTSVLDSICYALGGKSVQPVKPVRNGEKKAVIVCEMDDLIVTRTITDWGLADGYFADETSAENFYQDLTWLCLHQHGAFDHRAARGHVEPGGGGHRRGDGCGL